MDDLDSPWALIFAFVLREQALTAKYGEWGGRFVLIESGHAVQNLTLQLAHEGLSGVELAGYNDDRLARALGMDRVAANVNSMRLRGAAHIPRIQHLLAQEELMRGRGAFGTMLDG